MLDREREAGQGGQVQEKEWSRTWCVDGLLCGIPPGQAVLYAHSPSEWKKRHFLKGIPACFVALFSCRPVVPFGKTEFVLEALSFSYKVMMSTIFSCVSALYRAESCNAS